MGIAESSGTASEDGAPDRLPSGQYSLAWRYLDLRSRLIRTVEDVEIFSLYRSHKKIEVDISLPRDDSIAGDDSSSCWYLPVAFLEKYPIAPDLEVFDHAGNSISIPTKRECMALTDQAIEALSTAGLVNCTSPEMRELVWEVISSEAFEAYVVRSIAESRMAPDEDLLRSLMRRLEDRYILWVPVSGRAGSTYKILISRRQPVERNRILPPAIREVAEVVQTAAGPARVTFESPTGPPYPNAFEIAERLMQAFGLAPLVHGQEVPDARRASSFHLRVRAPEGFVVRDVKLGVGEEERLADSLTGQPSPETHPDVTLQGHESELGHLHCAREQNHGTLTMYTIFGIRDGLMTLWAGAVVFTAVLLWGFQRAAPYPVEDAKPGSLELAGAILLIGPALASAWAIRSDTGEVLERFMIGARTVLLLSAALSVLAALSLAGIRPSGWSYSQTIELYAAVGYVAAIPVSVAWMVSKRSTWFFYRDVLTTVARNLLSIAGVALLCAVVSFHDNPGDRWLGLVLLATGLAFAVIGNNRAGVQSVRERVYPFFALFGFVTTLVIAGYYLDLYGHHFAPHAIHLALLLSQFCLALSAGTAGCYRLWRG